MTERTTGPAATKKCDAKGCGSPATVNDRMGGRFCRGHSYLAAPAPKPSPKAKP